MKLRDILPRLVVLDFETFEILPRPDYPPEPVGYAIMDSNGVDYLAWGHVNGENSCAKSMGRAYIEPLWKDENTFWLFHNAPFDVAVACERMDLPMLPWWRIHDTQTLLFLFDPHAPNLQLKPSSERLLDWPPEERDVVHEWIWTHRKALEEQTGRKVKKSELGAWIAYAPVELVGPYAMGDVRRTLALFKYLYPVIQREGMGEAYDRERKIMPILLENEQQGLRVDLPLLQAQEPAYRIALETVENQMRGYLDAPGLSFDKDNDVSAAFERVGAIHEDRWVTTANSGQLSVSKVNLTPDAFVDPLLASAFGYRNRLVTCLKMFLTPWLAQAEKSGGWIFPRWNSTRNAEGYGTRTGRPSMSAPNLLNVAKSWTEGRNDGYVHPAELDLPELPLVRYFILPDEGHEFLHRDFDGQELRIFAHFEQGALLAAYLQNPALDPHTWVGDQIFELMGVSLDRTPIKIMNFQSLYGGGLDAIDAALKCGRAKAKEFKDFHNRALPGRALLSSEIQKVVRRGEPIRTWGGRLYEVEPPAYSKKQKRNMTFEYKLINYLIQGSAADLTKEAINDWYYGGGNSVGRFMLTVYDEIDLSVATGYVDESMAFLRECMERQRLSVPMRSSGKVGPRWGDVKKYEDVR